MVLPAESEAQSKHRIEPGNGRIFIDFRLLGLDLCLHRGISGGVHTAQTRGGVASAAGKVERGLGRSLKDNAKVVIESEMVIVRDQRAKAKQHHRRDFRDRHLAGTANRVGETAFEAYVAQIKDLSGGDVGFGRYLVTVVEQHARADVEPVTQRLDVQQCIRGPQLQRAVVVNAVVLESMAEIEGVETRAEVEQARHGYTKLAANAKRRSFDTNCKAGTSTYSRDGRNG
jgi:hypothetical protein